MNKYNVGSEGPRDAIIALVAEKGAWDEVKEGRPLVGTTGWYTRKHLEVAGLDAGRQVYSESARRKVWSQSRNVYLTNAVHNFDDPSANPTVAQIIAEQPRLYRELAALPNLKCIIALGNAALASLGNFQYSRQNNKGILSGITQQRGSVLETPLGVKMVPTFHPSFYVHGEWRFRSIVQFDINRAVEQSRIEGISRPYREYYIEPTLQEAVGWMDSMAEGEWLSFDIETSEVPKDSGRWYISCIAFSNAKDVAVCIPFMYPNRAPYWDLDVEAFIWRKVQWLLSLEHKSYVTQNGLFDCWHLRRHGIVTPYIFRGFDSMYSHRLLAPDLPHDLGFLTSLHTDEPYYKDESGRWDKTIAVPKQQFWIYNCKDAAVTLEVAQSLATDLGEYDMLSYYQDKMQTQWDGLMELQLYGMHIDTKRRKELETNANSIIAKGETQLETISSQSYIDDEGLRHGGPNTRSPIDMDRFLARLGVVPKRTKTGRPSVAEEELLTYAHNYPSARDAILTSIEITKQRTLLSNFYQPAVDADDFYHPSYDLSKTKTGRLASAGADEGGFQAQNLPGIARTMVIADDEESELTKADLKQAEAMVVAWDAQDNYVIEAFERGLDLHRIRAAIIFHNWSYDRGYPSTDLLDSIEKKCVKCVAEGSEDCSHSERFIGKQSGHAFAYKMGPRKWVNVILPGFGIFMTEARAKQIQSIVVSQAVLRWQERIFMQLNAQPWLEGPLGRKREFYGRLEKEGSNMHREALSWVAQHVISDITNDAMRSFNLLRDKQFGVSRYPDRPPARLITQTHDSVVVSHKKSLRAWVYDALERSFRKELMYHGRKLVIPIELASGPNWGGAK